MFYVEETSASPMVLVSTPAASCPLSSFVRLRSCSNGNEERVVLRYAMCTLYQLRINVIRRIVRNFTNRNRGNDDSVSFEILSLFSPIYRRYDSALLAFSNFIKCFEIPVSLIVADILNTSRIFLRHRVSGYN